MDIDQLRAFVLVANTKSFTRTAEQLNIVQSTVTTRIQMLERQIGKELFKRDKRNIALTDAGIVFLPYAERILELSDEGVKSVQLDKGYRDHIVIGTTHALWDYVLFEAIDTFQTLQPETSLVMITEHSDIIIRKMMDGIIDIGIVFYPVKHAKITMELMIEDSYVLVADPQFNIGETFLIPRDLRNLYIHLNWGGSFSEWYRQITSNQFFYHLEVDHVSLLLKFLKTRKGVGFLPNSVAKRLILQGQVINIPFMTDIPVPNRSIYMLKRNQTNPINNLELLMAYIKRIF
ncbi:LysR family transcriptional regulator [Metabacillus idriensis]|uniref:LysR family transcriptional regulator n=1 Tax=Metabacillus idriensis TaxID=324768 RepID=UPI00174BFD1E|nr:LysR family transcriptional regulator [Metabacillus idriensis]